MEFLDRQRRYLEITQICARHDMGILFDKLGLSGLAKGEAQDEPRPPMSFAERLRHLFEDLGPTFVKLGQIVSTRRDLLPPEYAAEFKKLQDDVAALPWEQIKTVAEEELGRPLEEVFAEVDPEPLAAASIGQVHRVTMQDGSPAVLKVQRPDIERVIRQDIAILRGLAETAATAGLAGPVDPVAILKEFERVILLELDYASEAHATEAFAQQHADDDQLVIPAVHWDCSGKRALTLEWIAGTKVSDIQRLRSSGHDLTSVAKKLLSVVLEQIFLHGRFHADPHPGNLMVLDDGRLAMIDFGMFGSFDRWTRRALTDLVRDMAEQDHRSMAQHLLQHELVGYDADIRQVQADLREMFRSVGGNQKPDEQMRIFLHFVTEHEVAFPPDLFFLDKVFGTLDGALRTLNPQISMRKAMLGHLPQLVQGAAKDWPSLLRGLAMRLLEAEGSLLNLPVELTRVLRRADAGHLGLRLQQDEEAERKRAQRALKCGLMALGLTCVAGAVVLEAAGATGLGAPVSWLAAGLTVFVCGAGWLALEK